MGPNEIITYLINEEEEEEEINTAVTTYSSAIHQMNNLVRHVGLIFNHCTINRNRALGNQLIYRDYFSDNHTYPDYLFRRRFRMRQTLYCRIQLEIESHDSYFVHLPSLDFTYK